MGKKLELRGMRFGRLVVLEEVGRDNFGRVTWRCKCDCGNTCVVYSGHLRSGNTTSCGCFKHKHLTTKKIDLVGQRFGRLLVLEEAGRDKHKNVLWKCRCDCGNECVVRSGALRSGHTASCGCFRLVSSRESLIGLDIGHNLSKHPLYGVWHTMLRRGGVHKGADDKTRRNYISRGISVCDEWRDFGNFAEWALSHGYEKGLQIDRIDNDGNYTPENCRWVTPKQNCNNKRNTLRLSDGTPLAMFANSFGIETRSWGYYRVRYTLKTHGEQSAVTLIFDLALEQFADKIGFTYIENALDFI